MDNHTLIVAIEYGDDDALAPGNKHKSSLVLPLGARKGFFGAKANQMAVECDLDYLLAYMLLLLIHAQGKDCRVKQQDFENFEQELALFAGIVGCFDRLTNKYIHENLLHVLFLQLIHIGDGTNDSPSLKMIKFQVGITLDAYNPYGGTSLDGILPRKASENLRIQKRVDFLARADHSNQGLFDALMNMLIIHISAQAGFEVFRVRNSIFG